MMITSYPFQRCTKHLLPVRGHFQKHMPGRICNVAYPIKSSSSCLTLKRGISRIRNSQIAVFSKSSWFLNCSFRLVQWFQCRSGIFRKKKPSALLKVKGSENAKGFLDTSIGLSSWPQDLSVRILMPKRRLLSEFRFTAGPILRSNGSGAAGLITGLLVCYSTLNSAHAEAPEEKGDKEESSDTSTGQCSHGKKVYNDYSVIGIPGDGSCLFRSVAHGACVRSGKPAPNESLQKQLADELRAMVADEFIRRRQETEWFIEGDFDAYVSHIRRPHVWGGEPELLMLSHVLRMPITVYMRDDKHDGLISIAEYGQEYGKDNPVRVLYHGYGHYDALLIPGKKSTKSRL